MTLAKRAELDTIEREEGAAYAAALSAGCTPQELRSLGFDAPQRRPRGRPRSTANRRARPTPRAAKDAESSPAGGGDSDSAE